uniref:Uncharacterized protein n=1 Tax=Pristionchus pacificus TaxID=54126 RepID=A0A2A6CPF4_PRIPA|eukprot:PDM80019.1 hypothetical protein PRIPAC_32598 [Pristionchus pacificus]
MLLYKAIATMKRHNYMFVISSSSRASPILITTVFIQDFPTSLSFAKFFSPKKKKDRKDP